MTEASVAFHAAHPERIPQRLEELDREWDVERVLETASATLSLTGLLLAVAKDRRWLGLTVGVQAFFLQHAIQGWCPPLPLLRRMGVRTAEEIDRERYALKALRGDFSNVDDEDRIQMASRAFRATGNRFEGLNGYH